MPGVLLVLSALDVRFSLYLGRAVSTFASTRKLRYMLQGADRCRKLLVTTKPDQCGNCSFESRYNSRPPTPLTETHIHSLTPTPKRSPHCSSLITPASILALPRQLLDRISSIHTHPLGASVLTPSLRSTPIRAKSAETWVSQQKKKKKRTGFLSRRGDAPGPPNPERDR